MSVEGRVFVGRGKLENFTQFDQNLRRPRLYHLRKNLRPSFSLNLLRVTHYHIFNFNF